MKDTKNDQGLSLNLQKNKNIKRYKKFNMEKVFNSCNNKFF